MAAIRRRNPQVAIEVLTPDFWGGHTNEAEGLAAQRRRLGAVLAAAPVCFNHNLETVERLTHVVRDPRAGYAQTLNVLAHAKRVRPSVLTKSSLMLGLGESDDEVLAAMRDRWMAGR